VFYDRVPLRALANALMSAGNTTDVTALRQVAISLSPTQAGAPVFPNVLAAAIPVTLPNLTTMDRHLQNASSRQASVEVERQIAARGTVSIGYHHLDGDGLLMTVNQNVPTCVAAGTNNGCRPNSTYGNNGQYSSAGESTYHGLHVSLSQSIATLGQYRVSYTLSTAMDNVGQFFFSSPIDPTDLSKDWSRSDNDQRHRLVVSGEVRRYGFEFGGMLQVYSQLPFNITSGVTTIQGTPGRPIVNGEFIERNAGKGKAFVSLNLRLSRAFAISERASFEALVEAFNVTNRTNVLTLNSNFGAGEYPASPSASFGQVTAVGDPRSVQIGLRLRF
jgi:hypothetical protein